MRDSLTPGSKSQSPGPKGEAAAEKSPENTVNSGIAGQSREQKKAPHLSYLDILKILNIRNLHFNFRSTLLIVSVVAAVVPLVTLAGAVWIVGSTTLQRQAADRLTASASDHQTRIEHWLDSLTVTLYEVTAAQPPLTDLMTSNFSGLNDRLQQAFLAQPISPATQGFSEYMLVGTDGRLLAATNPQRDLPPTRDCSSRVICVFGPFSESASGSGQFRLGVQYPLLDSHSQPIGALIGLTDARYFDTLMDQNASYLIGDAGDLRWLPGYGPFPNSQVNPPILARGVGISAAGTYAGVFDSPAEGVATYIPLLDAWLVHEEALSTIEQPLAVILPLTLALLALALAFILIGNRWLAGRLAQEQTVLRQQLAARESDLAELREAGQLRNHSMAGMSHELRTSLSATLNFSGFLLDGLFGDLSSEQLEPTRQIHDSAQHLLDLINDLLDMAKVEAGQIQLFPIDFDPAPVFEQAIATLRALTLGKPVEVRSDLPRAWPMLHADRRRVLQILLNLVANAAKFTEAGIITIRVHIYTNRLEVRVEDSGPGIDPADVKALFEPFRQGHNALLLEKGGTGLGLPLSRIFARMQGGDVQYEPGEHGGSTFIFWLPLTSPS